MADDTISRKAALNECLELAEARRNWETEEGQAEIRGIDAVMCALHDLPSAQPTLYGYNVEHLELIARVLQKENLPPERVVEALTDIASIVAIVRDEFEEILRKAVRQCVI